jgi:hypothetical protein
MQANPLDYASLRRQIAIQRERAWDLDRDIPWRTPIDRSRYFLPLDRSAIAFPGASEEQRRAISQLLGLVINGTIAEMESVIFKMKDIAWNQLLREYPVNPEMRELGERFCEDTGVDPSALARLLPKAFRSLFLRGTIANAQSGGFAFWWVVAVAEEVSIDIYRQIHSHRDAMDPLYHLVHKKHLEDESRHRNYAFLMLRLAHDRAQQDRFASPFRHLRRKTDLLLAQALSSGWVISELTKIFEVRHLRGEHPFFDVLASCLPLLQSVPPLELFRRLFVSAPYISYLLNTRNQRATIEAATEARVLTFPFPEPQPQPLLLPLSLSVSPDVGIPTGRAVGAE